LSSKVSRIVGLDIGGSKTHAIAASVDGRGGCQEVLAGSANLSSVGPDEATRQLSIVLDELGRDDITAICAGAAGVDSPEQEMRLAVLIQAQVPGAAVRIVHDTALILAAAGVQHGIALISGTGSVIWGRTPDGRTARAGGWGYLLGDEGSGYWVGREAVRHALERSERGEEPDGLALQLTADCGLQHPEQLLDHFYANPERRYWAGHSRLVFALAGRSDPAAAQIVDSLTDALAQLVQTVAGRLQIWGPVVLGGGLLTHQPIARAALTERLADAGFSDVRTLNDDPVHGALKLAREMAAGG
jgi:N-acetylglucosamine kinase-like BadF-type ATPase